MAKKLSRKVWRAKAEGVLGAGMTRKDSSGDIAVAEALRMPYLSQLRYLCTVSKGVLQTIFDVQ